MTTIDELTKLAIEKMVKLSDLRNKIMYQKGQIQALLDEVRKSEEFVKLEEDAKANASLADSFYNDLTEIAVAIYKATGKKKWLAGLGVREETVLEYDEAEAVKYCLKSLPGALKLDKSTFEKVAKAMNETPGRIPFVVVKKEDKGTVSTDLEKSLNEALNYDWKEVSG